MNTATQTFRTSRLAPAAVLASLLVLAGCGNSGGGVSTVGISPVLPTIYAPGQVVSLDAGATLGISAAVVNDPTRGGGTISLNGPGSISTPAMTPVAGSEQYSLNYTAPATVTAGSKATITITSVATPSATASLVITLATALTISTTSLPAGTVSKPYSLTLAASGGTGADTWTATGLPAGLSLSGGTITGTPTVAGTFTVAVSVTDSASVPNTVTQTYTLNITPSITTTTLANGVVGIAYSQQLAYAGGSGGAFAVTSGSLPTGLSLSAGGAITGTPAAAAAGLTYNFSVTVTVGSASSAAVPLTIVVDALPVITTLTLPNGNVGLPYSQQLAFTGGAGGTATWAVTAGTLPAGITLSTSGLLAGAPTTVGPYTFSIAVTVAVPGTSSSQTSVAQSYTVTVNSLIVTSSASVIGEVGLPFSFQLTAAGGTAPYTWQVLSGSLPTGLSLNGATGQITGKPTVSGTFTNVVVQTTDHVGATAPQTMTFTINPARGSTSNNNTALNGQYAFLLSGFDASGNPLAMAGEIVTNGNGGITSGVLDINGTGMTKASTNNALNATNYAVGTDNRGTLTLSYGSAPTVYTFVFSLNNIQSGVANGGYITEFDSTGQSLTGTLTLQTATYFNLASVAGGYAFGLEGFVAGSTSSSLTRRTMIGETQFTGLGGGSGELMATAATTSNPITPSNVTITMGTNGRGTLSYTYILSGTAQTTTNYVIYIAANNTKLLVLSTDAANAGGKDLMSGQELQQTILNGNYTSASLNGTGVVRMDRLYTTTAGALVSDAQVGLLTFSSGSKIAISADEDTGGTVSTDTRSGSYSVNTNGRVTLSLQAGLSGCADCISGQTYVYLAGQNQGFLMDFNAQPNFGYFENQTATGIAESSVSGSYSIGSLSPVLPAATDISASVTANSSAGTITGTADKESAGTLAADTTLNATYTVSGTGRTTLATTGNGQVLYVISATKALLLDLTAPAPVVEEMLHQ